MKREICNHCGSECFIDDYTPELLRERILSHVMKYNSKPSELIAALSKEGFKAQDVKLQASRLWDEGKLELQEHGSWVTKVIVT